MAILQIAVRSAVEQQANGFQRVGVVDGHRGAASRAVQGGGAIIWTLQVDSGALAQRQAHHGDRAILRCQHEQRAPWQWLASGRFRTGQPCVQVHVQRCARCQRWDAGSALTVQLRRHQGIH